MRWVGLYPRRCSLLMAPPREHSCSCLRCPSCPGFSGVLSRWLETPPVQSDRVIDIVTHVREFNSDRNLTYPFSADVT
jgi:hypothetical protein